jgi:hypothetical protein
MVSTDKRRSVYELARKFFQNGRQLRRWAQSGTPCRGVSRPESDLASAELIKSGRLRNVESIYPTA